MQDRGPAYVPPATRWRLLRVTAIGSFMGTFDGTVVAVALPAMGAHLHFGFMGGIWVQTLYLLAMTVALIPVGRVSDALGRLRLYRVGVVVFAVSSVGAALSPSLALLLVARCLQGLGSALMSATGTAIVSASFPANERGRALGINVTSLYLGLVLGPVLGGLLTQHLGWQSIFFVNVLVGAAALVGSIGLGERPPERALHADVPGMALLAVGLAAALGGISIGPIAGWTRPEPLGLLAVGLGALAAFVWVESRARNPLLDPSLFTRSRGFSAGTVTALLVYTGVFGVTSLTSVYLEVVGRLPPQRAGLMLAIQPVFMVGLSSLAGRLSDRFGSRLLATGGVVVVAAGMGAIAAAPGGGGAPVIEVGLALVGIGMAAFSSPNTSAVMGAAPRASLGTASGVLSAMRVLGQSLSTAVLGALAMAPLGRLGEQQLFTGHGGGLEAAAYAGGFRPAMAVGAFIALVGAAVSASRPPRAQVPSAREHGG